MYLQHTAERQKHKDKKKERRERKKDNVGYLELSYWFWEDLRQFREESALDELQERDGLFRGLIGLSFSPFVSIPANQHQKS